MSTTKLLVQFPSVASPVPLMVSRPLYSRWAQTEWASCRLFNVSLCWLGQAHPLFVLDSGLCRRGTRGYREGVLACVPQPCAWVCGDGFESIQIAHACTERGCTATQRPCWPWGGVGWGEGGAGSACLRSSETELTGLWEKPDPVIPPLFSFFIGRHHTKVYASTLTVSFNPC